MSKTLQMLVKLRKKKNPKRKRQVFSSLNLDNLQNDYNISFFSESKTWSRLSNNHKNQEKEEIQKDYLDTGMYLISPLMASMTQPN